MIYFTSDTHFGHSNIIKYSKRPFRDVAEMDEMLIQNWNAKVGPHDIIYHLGDFTFHTKVAKVTGILDRLNGIKRFLFGNHDHIMEDPEIISRFDWMGDYAEVRETAYPRMVLCHFPMLTWNKAHKGSFMLHGHCHGTVDYMNKDTTRMDVGVDPQGYFPISINEVTARLSKINYKPVDHHGAM